MLTFKKLSCSREWTILEPEGGVERGAQIGELTEGSLANKSNQKKILTLNTNLRLAIPLKDKHEEGSQSCKKH